MRGDAAIQLDVLIADGGREGVRGGGAFVRRKGRDVTAPAIERPAEIHGGRTCGEKRGVGAIESAIGSIFP